MVTGIEGPSVARGPAVSGMTRSASRMASSGSLVIRMTVFFSSWQIRLISSCRFARVSASSALSGSSSRRILRLERQRPCHRDALAHAAGEFAGDLVARRSQIHHRDVLFDVLRGVCSRTIRRKPGPRPAQCFHRPSATAAAIVLKHDAAIRPGSVHRFAVQLDRACIGLDQSGQQ